MVFAYIFAHKYFIELWFISLKVWDKRLLYLLDAFNRLPQDHLHKYPSFHFQWINVTFVLEKNSIWTWAISSVPYHHFTQIVYNFMVGVPKWYWEGPGSENQSLWFSVKCAGWLEQGYIQEWCCWGDLFRDSTPHNTQDHGNRNQTRLDVHKVYALIPVLSLCHYCIF